MSRAARVLSHRSHRLRHMGGGTLLILFILWIGLWLATSYQLNSAIDQWEAMAQKNEATLSYSDRYTDGSPWKLHVHIKDFSFKHPKGHRLEADEAIFYLYIWDWKQISSKFKGLIRGQVDSFSFSTESLKLALKSTPTQSFDQTNLFFQVKALGVRPHVKEDPLLGRRIQELDFNILLNGALPDFDAPQSINEWSQKGGLIQVENLGLSWGTLSLVGQGTLSLNDERQPEGVFSARTKGISKTLKLCAAQECLSPLEERMLNVSLNVLSTKNGFSGYSSTTVPFLVQNGGLYIGPVKIGTVPKIEW